MLLSFKVDNFLSFADAQQLDLLPARGLRKDDPHPPLTSGGAASGALPVVAVFGANASGKTNLIRALHFFSSAVKDSQIRWRPGAKTPVTPFALDETLKKPSTLEAEFLLGETRYEYGFALDSERITREWLHAYPKGRRQVWFQRSIERSQIYFGKKLLGDNRRIEGLTRPNSLFLSAAAQHNHEMLMAPYQWLTNAIRFTYPTDRVYIDPTARDVYFDARLREAVSKLLPAADLGILSLEVKEEEMPGNVRDALTTFVESVKKLAPESMDLPALPEKFPEVTFRHRSKEAGGTALPLTSESAGTVSFVLLAFKALAAMRSGCVLCVDELGSSLHPLLMAEVVRLFADPERNKTGAQLIFNSHDIYLLRSGLLRRDEIWFAEKDRSGGTRLYSLGDFSARRRENILRGYLQGRFGGVPVVSSIGPERPEA